MGTVNMNDVRPSMWEYASRGSRTSKEVPLALATSSVRAAGSGHQTK